MSIILGILWFCGLFLLSQMHDTVPTELWPLTEITQSREVMKGITTADLHPNVPPYTDHAEPKLQYNALLLNGPSYVNISMEWELGLEQFMLMGMFYVNLDEESYFFKYDTPSLVFSVYTKRCKIYVTCRIDKNNWQMDDCVKDYRWYTVAVKWNKGKMYIFIVWADPNKTKGDTVLNFEAKELFPDVDYLPSNGTLYIGNPLVNGPPRFAVACLRIYNEEFDKSHVEDQMYEDCQKEDHWNTSIPNRCGIKPCQNGGTCYPNPTDFFCICRPWFTGQRCDEELWMTHQSFTFIAKGDVFLTPMLNSLNLTVVGRRECATLCLKNNYCLSFTIHDETKCTLYGDYTLAVETNELCRYYIVTSHMND